MENELDIYLVILGIAFAFFVAYLVFISIYSDRQNSKIGKVKKIIKQSKDLSRDREKIEKLIDQLNIDLKGIRRKAFIRVNFILLAQIIVYIILEYCYTFSFLVALLMTGIYVLAMLILVVIFFVLKGRGTVDKNKLTRKQFNPF